MDIWLTQEAVTSVIFFFVSLELIHNYYDEGPHVVDMDADVFAPAALEHTEQLT